jgi:hypothetical protein
MGLHVATEFWGFTGTAPDNKENEPFLKWLLQVGPAARKAPYYMCSLIQPPIQTSI